MGQLTNPQIGKLPAGRHSDGDGLSLLVKPSGKRSWVLRYRDRGKRVSVGLGGWPQVTLHAARVAARRKLAEAHEQPPAPTFGQAAEEALRQLEPTWRNPQTHGRKWRRSLELHAEPLLAMRVDEITRADVIGVLEPIWHTKPETARTVRQRIRLVMARVMAYDESIVSNPAGEGIDGALVSRRKATNHYRALPAEDVPAALAQADARCDKATGLCLRFLVLTAARSKEAREARWAEIDFDARCWVLPAERMKAGKAHRVPLSGAAVDVLLTAKGLDDGSGYVFPGSHNAGTGRPVGDKTLRRLLATAGIDSTVHGFRSSFRDWALRQPGVSFEAAERALAHAVGSTVTQAYLRDDLLEERRVLMEMWADHIGSVS